MPNLRIMVQESEANIMSKWRLEVNIISGRVC